MALDHVLAAVTPIRGTSVYLHYDTAGRLIYIGITGKGQQRADQHSKTSEWWRFAARSEIEHCADRKAAAKRETELIRLHRPPFNKQGNPGWAEIRNAYLAVVHAETQYARVLAGESTDDCRICSSDSDDCDPCQWGVEFPFRHDLSGIGCGRVECQICHSRFHGVEEGLPIGWEAGRRRDPDGSWEKGWDEATAIYAADSMAGLCLRAVVDRSRGWQGRSYAVSLPGMTYPFSGGPTPPSHAGGVA